MKPLANLKGVDNPEESQANLEGVDNPEESKATLEGIDDPEGSTVNLEGLDDPKESLANLEGVNSDYFFPLENPTNFKGKTLNRCSKNQDIFSVLIKILCKALF